MADRQPNQDQERPLRRAHDMNPREDPMDDERKSSKDAKPEKDQRAS